MASGDHPWISTRNYSPHKQLFQAIILQAVKDIVKEEVSPGTRDYDTRAPHSILAAKARNWIFSDNEPIYEHRTGVTFRECCDLGDLNPYYLRRLLQRTLDSFKNQNITGGKPTQRKVNQKVITNILSHHILRGDQTNHRRTKGFKNV